LDLVTKQNYRRRLFQDFSWRALERSTPDCDIGPLREFEDKEAAISKIATKSIFWWCSNQVEKGFGGTIVPRRFGHNKATCGTDNVHLVDRKAIDKWLEDLEAISEGGDHPEP